MIVELFWSCFIGAFSGEWGKAVYERVAEELKRSSEVGAFAIDFVQEGNHVGLKIGDDAVWVEVGGPSSGDCGSTGPGRRPAGARPRL